MTKSIDIGIQAKSQQEKISFVSTEGVLMYGSAKEDIPGSFAYLWQPTLMIGVHYGNVQDYTTTFNVYYTVQITLRGVRYAPLLGS